MNSQTKTSQAAQVYFPVEMYIAIKEIAKDENKAIAEWIRDIISKELKKKQRKKVSLTDLPTFNWKTKENNISEKIDEIVYEL